MKKANKIEGTKIQAQGGLYSAYQTAQVKIKGSLGEKDMKLGLEIKMIPIVNGKEDDRFKPKSFYVNKGEIVKWDQLIFEMVKYRWMFAVKSGWMDSRLTFAIDENDRRKMLQEMVDYFIKKVKEHALQGLEERRKYKELV